MEKFDWLATESAPENYPMEIVRGNFLLKGGSSLYVPSRKVFYKGWGMWVSTHVTGETLKPLPEGLEIAWFSYTENKFYAGRFALPYDKILARFREGFESSSTGRMTTYDRIMVGLAPEGEVSLWLVGVGTTLEVAHYKAEETDIDWKRILDNENVSRSEYIQMVFEESMSAEEIARLENKGIPKGLWHSYRKQHRWEPEIIGARPLSMRLKTFNGEQEYFNFLKDGSDRTDRAVPKEIVLTWQSSSGVTYKTTTLFDEEEIFKAYAKLTETNPEPELKLQLEISNKSRTIDVALRDSQFILELERNHAKTYKAGIQFTE